MVETPDSGEVIAKNGAFDESEGSLLTPYNPMDDFMKLGGILRKGGFQKTIIMDWSFCSANPQRLVEFTTSQVLPPSLRFEVTSSHLVCTFLCPWLYLDGTRS
jgi:hypothetical protein